MELIERLDVLLGMKERANRAYFRAYDYDTAISIVNAHWQSESEMSTPFATEQFHLHLSRLLSEMNREIEHAEWLCHRIYQLLEWTLLSHCLFCNTISAC